MSLHRAQRWRAGCPPQARPRPPQPQSWSPTCCCRCTRRAAGTQMIRKRDVRNRSRVCQANTHPAKHAGDLRPVAAANLANLTRGTAPRHCRASICLESARKAHLSAPHQSGITNPSPPKDDRGRIDARRSLRQLHRRWQAQQAKMYANALSRILSNLSSLVPPPASVAAWLMMAAVGPQRRLRDL